MSGKEIHDLIYDAFRYPLPLRIAAKLWIEGITEAEFVNHRFDVRLPENIVLQVQNNLRDNIRIGRIDSRLLKLADQLKD